MAGRARADRGLLLLVGLVVALTTALTAAVAPITVRTADRAIAAAVDGAGSRSTVVATLQPWYDDPSSDEQYPDTAGQVRRDADAAAVSLPGPLRAVLRPGITTITTLPLQLLDAGPGRYLQLAYVDTVDGGPSVSYTSGRSPRGSRPGTSRAEDGTWPVQVAVSEAVAEALDLRVGDRVPARDEQFRAVTVEVSGTFEATDEEDQAWQAAMPLLHPTTGTSDGLPISSGAALVPAESLPDLRLALPGDALTHRVVFWPDSARMRWMQSTSLERSVVSLQAGAGVATDGTTWDSLLGTVLREGQAQVSSARGQAQVLVVGLLACALLVLVLAAQLLVRRRTASLAMARERGATLPGIAGELAVESLAVAGLGATVGLAATRLLAGSVGWGWSVPVVVVSALTAPLLGAVAAGHVTGARRVPANRSSRRRTAQAVQLRRVGWELGVLAAAALSFVALHQRGVVGDDDGTGAGDLTATSAVTWGAVAAALVLLRLLPPALRTVLRASRRSSGGVTFFVAARLTETGTRVMPALLACTAVAQVTFGVSLAATTRDGQAAGALSAVGGDARIDAQPAPTLVRTAGEVARAPGVEAVVAGRVEDGVRVSASGDVAAVRLVVVDAAALEDLLATSDLADAPQLARLRTDAAGRVPALLRGGSSGLRDGPNLRWEDASVPLDVVGTAPDVDASVDPVLVVDAESIAAAGVVAPPDTVWAVGPGAADALRAVAPGVAGSDPVVTYADELDTRRDAALPSAVVALAAASGALLMLLALLGTVLAAAADAPARGSSCGRLRALGLADRDLRRVLVGELVVPVGVSGLVGLVVGVVCAHAALGSLSLERLTGAPGSPEPVVPWWTVVLVVVLVACAAALSVLEWQRTRRTPLAQLLRT